MNQKKLHAISANLVTGFGDSFKCSINLMTIIGFMRIISKTIHFKGIFIVAYFHGGLVTRLESVEQVEPALVRIHNLSFVLFSE